MARLIWALSGWRNSGKDTTADLLVQEYGFTKLSFAAKLKDMVARDYRIPREWLDDTTRKEMPLAQYPVIPGDSFSASLQEKLQAELISGYWTPRALCILEGSAKRAVHSNYWVQSIVSEIMADTSDSDFVISDLRYQTEADTLKLLLPGITLVRIQRFDSIGTLDPSERDLDNYKFNYTLENRRTVDELYNQISNIPDLNITE